LDRELDGPIEHFDQFLATLFVFFFAEHLRQEEHRKAVAIRVLMVGVRVADESVLARLGHQVVDRLANVLGVRTLRRRGTRAGERRTGERGHGGRVVGSGPVTELRLRTGDPLQPTLDRAFPIGILLGSHCGARQASASGQPRHARQCLQGTATIQRPELRRSLGHKVTSGKKARANYNFGTGIVMPDG
jgi:hypothetical protein